MNTKDNGIRSVHPFLQAPIQLSNPSINNATRVNVVKNAIVEDPLQKEVIGMNQPSTVFNGASEWLDATNQQRVAAINASTRILTKQRYI
jgi:hypothetical protein